MEEKLIKRQIFYVEMLLSIIKLFNLAEMKIKLLKNIKNF